LGGLGVGQGLAGQSQVAHEVTDLGIELSKRNSEAVCHDDADPFVVETVARPQGGRMPADLSARPDEGKPPRRLQLFEAR